MKTNLFIVSIFVVVAGLVSGGCSGSGDDSSANAPPADEAGGSGGTASAGAPGKGGWGGASGGTGGSGGQLTGSAGASADGEHSRFLTAVISFTPGEGAGYGQDKMPGVVFGPPVAAADPSQGGLDVVSLGHLGEIVVEFGENEIVDGDGPDFIVFENPFIIGGDKTMVFAEPGEVSVSDDGITWSTFPCDPMNLEMSSCAGVHPVYSSPTNGISPLDPSVSGGDPFDLKTLGITQAKYVRIRDMSTAIAAPTAGFDLDAMSIVNAEYPLS